LGPELELQLSPKLKSPKSNALALLLKAIAAAASVICNLLFMFYLFSSGNGMMMHSYSGPWACR
jgi:hypothetical protein